MKQDGGKRVGIFQAEYPVISQTANCAITLAEAGYGVDLFIFNAWNTWIFVEREKLEECEAVHIYEFNDGPSLDCATSSRTEVIPSGGFKRRLKAIVRATVPGVITLRDYVRSAARAAGLTLRTVRNAFPFLVRSEDGLVPQQVVAWALQRVASHDYRFLIGLEKKGLIWAGQIAEKVHVPLIYYSTELYTEDYWRIVNGGPRDFKQVRLAERKNHRKASATIVQDPDRARVLFRGNGLSMTKATIFYVPVSLRGGPYKERSWYLHETLSLPRDRKVILYFGLMWERRHVLDLARVAQSFPEDWILVMHGWEWGSAVEKIKAVDRANRVKLSLELAPSDKLQELVASADIGLAFYSDLTENDRLTAFSSEKMALYMQCGVPFIAFDYPGYRRLANEDGCGVVIQNLEQLPGAIRKILMSHDDFRQRAFRAFRRHYDFARNFAQVVEGIGSL